MFDVKKLLSDIELNEIMSIRGTSCQIIKEAWVTTFRWYHASGKYTEREVQLLYVESLPNILDIVKHARLEILTTFPYCVPDQILLNKWYNASFALRLYVDSQDTKPFSVLTTLFNGPSAPFLEILLVRLGEI